MKLIVMALLGVLLAGCGGGGGSSAPSVGPPIVPDVNAQSPQFLTITNDPINMKIVSSVEREIVGTDLACNAVIPRQDGNGGYEPSLATALTIPAGRTFILTDVHSSRNETTTHYVSLRRSGKEIMRLPGADFQHFLSGYVIGPGMSLEVATGCVSISGYFIPTS